MSVIYEIRGKLAEFGRARNQPLFRVCRRLSVLHRPWLRRMTWERWTTGARPRKNILS